ncbi:hypothetical protein PsorP6_013402 [Peronosclerospora sorghi]|uniref:Uncharacterized protein n=1 Tax=Peronosclerospora sorghi TaxID=230839 RepID=A0ACC0VJY1_9STRA|nr:hypothetical protein PsorP6_013402 [Peronosclerospora sorghi]
MDCRKLPFPVLNLTEVKWTPTYLRGDLAPEGSVAKITGKEGLVFTGTAKVYDCEEDMMSGLEKNDVVIIRYEGPKSGPGMPEMRKRFFAL